MNFLKLKISYINFLKGGMTQIELAKKIGITPQYLSNILNRGWCNMKIVNRLAKALNVDPQDIVKLED